jgi:hypothetical protein
MVVNDRRFLILVQVQGFETWWNMRGNAVFHVSDQNTETDCVKTLPQKSRNTILRVGIYGFFLNRDISLYIETHLQGATVKIQDEHKLSLQF